MLTQAPWKCPGEPNVGPDGSTDWNNVNVLKWNTPEEFDEAEFSFKIDYEKFSQDYDVEKVEFQVMAKAGTSYSTGYVPEATFNTVTSTVTPSPADETPDVSPLTDEETASLPPEYTTEEPADVTTPDDEETTPAEEETTPAEDNTQEDYVDEAFDNIAPSAAAETVNEDYTSGDAGSASGGTAATPEPATMFLLGLVLRDLQY